MATHGSVAASVRRNKERNPADYCTEARCLWNVGRSGPCPKHQARVLVSNDPTEIEHAYHHHTTKEER